MENFSFISPTKMYFGKKAETNLSDSLKEYKKVLVVYGTGSIKKNGIYDKVIEELKKSKVEYFELSGVRANPCISKVIEGLEIARKEHRSVNLDDASAGISAHAECIVQAY